MVFSFYVFINSIAYNQKTTLKTSDFFTETQVNRIDILRHSRHTISIVFTPGWRNWQTR